jgi:hypothetical protein
MRSRWEGGTEEGGKPVCGAGGREGRKRESQYAEQVGGRDEQPLR